MLQNKKGKPVNVLIIILVIIPPGIAMEYKGTAQLKKCHKLVDRNRKMQGRLKNKSPVQQPDHPYHPFPGISSILQQPSGLLRIHIKQLSRRLHGLCNLQKIGNGLTPSLSAGIYGNLRCTECLSANGKCLWHRKMPVIQHAVKQLFCSRRSASS